MDKVFPVTTSDAPLVFDTLPALKTSHFFHGDSLASRDVAKVYTYARLYIYGGALQLNLTAFERGPGPESRVAFALSATGAGKLALIELSPHGASLTLLPRQPVPGLWQPPCQGTALAPEPFAGEDEQGWYWGAQMAVPANLLAQAGFSPEVGARFGGALLKYRTDDHTAWGSSASPGAAPLDYDSFGQFEAVRY